MSSSQPHKVPSNLISSIPWLAKPCKGTGWYGTLCIGFSNGIDLGIGKISGNGFSETITLIGFGGEINNWSDSSTSVWYSLLAAGLGTSGSSGIGPFVVRGSLKGTKGLSGTGG